MEPTDNISVFTRDQIASRIIAGEALFIYRDLLIYAPPSWLDAHPGGSLAILHFVGRDATDVIEAFHSQERLKCIRRYAVGRIEPGEHGWETFLPPIMSGWTRKTGKDGKQEWFREAGALTSVKGTGLSHSSQILLVDKNNTFLQPATSAPTLETIEPAVTDLSTKLQAKHSAAYKVLHQRLEDAGLYKTQYLIGYGWELAQYLFLGGFSALAYAHNWLIISPVFLGLLWHQLVFAAHDLGHSGVTHDWTIDRIFGTIITNFIGGLSIGWWVDSHNIHHLVTNHPSHDPDIEHLPFFAISPLFFQSLWSSYHKRTMTFDHFAKFFVSLQHKLFYVVLAFGRFNLYAHSYSFLYRKAFDTRRTRGGRWAWWLELVGLLFFWSWYGALLKGCGSWSMALAYLMISHITTSPLHVQIVLSHFLMSTDDLGPRESFAHLQLRTTTDIICPPSLEFLHGGLHKQVTHHLFPRLPRHNLRKASVLVKEFAREQGLVYAETGFSKGTDDVIGILRGMSEQVKLLQIVADVEVKEAVGKRILAAEKQHI